MTRNEMKQLLMMMQAMFPSWTPKFGLSETIDTWMFAVGEQDYAKMVQALKVYSNTNNSGFAPAPGQLVNLIRDVEKPYISTAGEAWGIVVRAARDGIYHAKERFEAFPDIVKACVGSPENLVLMSQLEESQLETVIQSHFLKEYRKMEETYRQEELYPEKVKAMIREKRSRELTSVLRSAERPALEMYDE